MLIFVCVTNDSCRREKSLAEKGGEFVERPQKGDARGGGQREGARQAAGETHD